MNIVPPSTYHVAVKYSPGRNRVVAEFTTVVDPRINIEFPLPDTYMHGSDLSENDEELLSLMFSQIVETALKGIRQQQELQQLLSQRGPQQDQGLTQDVLAGDDEPEAP